ncbi:MAG: protein kinase, partial [Planctomycetes bacterium]|nr:protein kinase [Planctomycetota bacterium]
MNPANDSALKTLWERTLGPEFPLDGGDGRESVGRGTELGRGGMGVVHRELQDRLERNVAVKRIRPDRSDDPRMIERFLAEARINGMLDHPNVVPVHELHDDEEGRPVLVMKLVEGRTWAEILDESRDDPARRMAALDRHLEILLDVCNGVAFAHARQIIHRDLKPANVMVGEFGEVLVMDWGLGIDVSPDRTAPPPIPHVSSITEPMGSPAYMAPELARADGTKITTRSDIYLLGATLHEILTGRPPHVAETRWKAIMAADNGKIPAYDAAVPAELAAIARHAMARDAADRPATVLDFADAIRAFREHRASLKLSQSANEALAQAEAHSPERYGQLSEAIEGHRQALVLWPENPEAGPGLRAARLARAQAALEARDLELAAEELRSLEGSDAESERLGRDLRVARKATARARLKARLLTWSIAALLLTMAAGLFLVNQSRGREVAARLAEKKSSASTAYAAGQLAARSGRWDEALTRYETALAQGHEDP